MRKVLRWLIAIAVGLAVLAAVLFTIARLRGPSEEHRAAMAVLKPSPPPAGRNGFALLWLIDHPVPAAEREQVLAEDVQRFTSRGAPERNTFDVEQFESVAADRYPGPPMPDREQFCRWSKRDCLARVRADPQAYAELLATHAALIARADEISGFGHVRSPFQPRLDQPFPSFGVLAYPMTRHAHAFVSGDYDAGLAGACRGVSAARMFIRSGDNLIGAMFGAAMLEGNAALLADMLAELPVDHPLPDACATAFAPALADEFSMCETMRGESRYIFGTMQGLVDADDRLPRPWHDHFWPVVVNLEKTVARMAAPMAWYCGTQARAGVTADVPVQPMPEPAGSFLSLECFDNYFGCALADLGQPAIGEYQHRLQDASMRLKTTATLLWLREQPMDQPLPDRLARRPMALRSPRRELKADPAGTSVTVALFSTRDGGEWTLPVPGSRTRAHP